MEKIPLAIVLLWWHSLPSQQLYPNIDKQCSMELGSGQLVYLNISLHWIPNSHTPLLVSVCDHIAITKKDCLQTCHNLVRMGHKMVTKRLQLLH